MTLYACQTCRTVYAAPPPANTNMPADEGSRCNSVQVNPESGQSYRCGGRILPWADIQGTPITFGPGAMPRT